MSENETNQQRLERAEREREAYAHRLALTVLAAVAVFIVVAWLFV